MKLLIIKGFPHLSEVVAAARNNTAPLFLLIHVAVGNRPSL